MLDEVSGQPRLRLRRILPERNFRSDVAVVSRPPSRAKGSKETDFGLEAKATFANEGSA